MLNIAGYSAVAHFFRLKNCSLSPENQKKAKVGLRNLLEVVQTFLSGFEYAVLETWIH